jgi:ABC-type branched-subunit amino acid transport system substrate-binding protein
MARRFRRLAAATLALALVAAACGNSGDDSDDTGSSDTGSDEDVEIADPSERETFVEITGVPGVDDEEIRFSSITTISGNPLGTNIGPAYNAGINAYFDYRNAEGGIYGRDLVLANERDDELLAHDREAQAVVSEDDSFGAFSATLNSSGLDILGEAGVPTFIWNIAPEYDGQESIFGQVAPLCVECTGRILSYMAQELGATTVGIIGYGTTDVSTGCADSQRESFELFADETGVEVGFFDNTLPFGLPNGVAPEVSAMKEAGVDFITTCVDINGMKTLGDEVAAQQLDATLYHPNTYNADFVAENAEIFEGDIVVPGGFLAFESGDDIPLRDAYLDNIPADVASEELAMTGWLNAHLAFTGLLSAGPEFDRATVVGALRATDDYSADGLSAPVDWSRQIEIPTVDTPEIDYEQECFNAVQVQDGEFSRWSGTDEEPWVCFDLPRDEWAEPVTASFAG